MSNDVDQYGKTEKPFSSPYEAKPEPPRRSGCMKYFVIASIFGLLAVVACCVGGVIFIINGFVTDPDEIEQLAREMVDWEFNDELDGAFGIDNFVITVAGLSERDRGMIILMQSRFIADSESADEVRSSIREQMEIGSDENREKTDIVESEERSIDIRGESVDVTFNKTKGRRTDRIYWEVAAIIPGEPYPVVIFMQLHDDAYNGDVIEQRLRDIR